MTLPPLDPDISPPQVRRDRDGTVIVHYASGIELRAQTVEAHLLLAVLEKLEEISERLS